MSTCSGLGATINVATNSTIGTLKLPVSVTTLTGHAANLTTLEAGGNLGTVNTIAGLTSVKLTGTAAANAASYTTAGWLETGTNIASGTIDISGVTGHPTTMDFATNTATTILKVPTDVDTLTTNAAVVELTAGVALASLTGPTSLTSITLTGNGGGALAAEAWLNTANNTAAAAVTVDLSGASNLGATVDLATNSEIDFLKMPTAGGTTTITAHANLITLECSTDVTTITAGPNALTSVKLHGAGASVPGWATDGVVCTVRRVLVDVC